MFAHPSRLLLVLFPLVVHTQCRTHSSTFPTPNICTRISTNEVFGSWLSEDCPIDAVCVPPPKDSHNSTSYCSCSHQSIFLKEKDGRCVATAGDYVFSALFSLVVAVAFGSVFGGSLLVCNSVSAHIFNRKDSILHTTVLAILSNIFGGVQVFTQAWMYGGKSHVARMELRWLQAIAIGFQSLVTFAVVVTFGFAVHAVAVRSITMRACTDQKVPSWFVTTAVMAFVLLGLLVPMLTFQQYALASSVWGLFATFNVLLYSRTIGWITKLERYPSIATTATADQRVPETLHCIRVLSRRLFANVFVFTTLSVANTMLWFVGRHNRSEAMLGPGYTTLVLLQNVCVVSAMVWVILFFWDMRGVRVRSSIARNSVVATSPRSTSSRVIEDDAL